MLTEIEGTDVLARAFAARGYSIARDVPFDEAGVTCTLDGWDAGARVGFEYLTRDAGDHEDLTADELGRLWARMERGELYVFLVDERDVESAAELESAAGQFLDEVKKRRGGA
ncbi:MAG TPA: hypothetical protein VGO62_13580 [Myxococcota bacterium]|jgi:hypothetical protein